MCEASHTRFFLVVNVLLILIKSFVRKLVLGLHAKKEKRKPKLPIHTLYCNFN